MSFWCLQIYQKTNENVSRIFALASKKRLNKKNKALYFLKLFNKGLFRFDRTFRNYLTFRSCPLFFKNIFLTLNITSSPLLPPWLLVRFPVWQGSSPPLFRKNFFLHLRRGEGVPSCFIMVAHCYAYCNVNPSSLLEKLQTS